MGQSRPFLFSFFPRYNLNTNWKKRRWCAWDSNPGPQDGKRRQNHGAMAATRNDALPLTLNWSQFDGYRYRWIVKAASINYDDFCFLTRPNPASLFIFVLQRQLWHKFDHKWLKRRWCAWVLNPGWQNGRLRWNHWAMAAPHNLLCYMPNTNQYLRWLKKIIGK